jgi:hypothetical protein
MSLLKSPLQNGIKECTKSLEVLNDHSMEPKFQLVPRSAALKVVAILRFSLLVTEEAVAGLV